MRGDRLIHPNLNSHISTDLFSIHTTAFHGACEWDQLLRTDVKISSNKSSSSVKWKILDDILTVCDLPTD